MYSAAGINLKLQAAQPPVQVRRCVVYQAIYLALAKCLEFVVIQLKQLVKTDAAHLGLIVCLHDHHHQQCVPVRFSFSIVGTVQRLRDSM